MELAVVFAIGLLLVAGVLFAVINASKKAKVVQLQAEAKEFIDKVVATGKITVPDGIPVVLGTDETALLHEPSKLIEARATTVYAGAGTRVKGIYIGGGESRSVQSLKVLDSGTLTLTTKRLVFTGSMESRVVNVKDVVSIEPFADAIQLSTGKRAKRQVYMVHNPVIWVTLIRSVISGALKVTATKAVGASEVESRQQHAKPVASSGDIHFNCPRCGQHLAVETRGAGMAVSCPGCNEQIEIPSSTAPPLPPSVTGL